MGAVPSHPAPVPVTPAGQTPGPVPSPLPGPRPEAGGHPGLCLSPSGRVTAPRPRHVCWPVAPHLPRSQSPFWGSRRPGSSAWPQDPRAVRAEGPPASPTLGSDPSWADGEGTLGGELDPRVTARSMEAAEPARRWGCEGLAAPLCQANGSCSWGAGREPRGTALDARTLPRPPSDAAPTETSSPGTPSLCPLMCQSWLAEQGPSAGTQPGGQDAGATQPLPPAEAPYRRLQQAWPGGPWACLCQSSFTVSGHRALPSPTLRPWRLPPSSRATEDVWPTKPKSHGLPSSAPEGQSRRASPRRAGDQTDGSRLLPTSSAFAKGPRFRERPRTRHRAPQCKFQAVPTPAWCLPPDSLSCLLPKCSRKFPAETEGHEALYGTVRRQKPGESRLLGRGPRQVVT